MAVSTSYLGPLVRPSVVVQVPAGLTPPEACRHRSPRMEAIILHRGGTHCLPDEPGELDVKGANVTLGEQERRWNVPDDI